jgi:hypothetical protein
MSKSTSGILDNISVMVLRVSRIFVNTLRIQRLKRSSLAGESVHGLRADDAWTSAAGGFMASTT